jgi:hypothetical protein
MPSNPETATTVGITTLRNDIKINLLACHFKDLRQHALATGKATARDNSADKDACQKVKMATRPIAVRDAPLKPRPTLPANKSAPIVSIAIMTRPTATPMPIMT